MRERERERESPTTVSLKSPPTGSVSNLRSREWAKGEWEEEGGGGSHPNSVNNLKRHSFFVNYTVTGIIAMIRSSPSDGNHLRQSTFTGLSADRFRSILLQSIDIIVEFVACGDKILSLSLSLACIRMSVVCL